MTLIDVRLNPFTGAVGTWKGKSIKFAVHDERTLAWHPMRVAEADAMLEAWRLDQQNPVKSDFDPSEYLKNPPITATGYTRQSVSWTDSITYTTGTPHVTLTTTNATTAKENKMTDPVIRTARLKGGWLPQLEFKGRIVWEAGRLYKTEAKAIAAAERHRIKRVEAVFA